MELVRVLSDIERIYFRFTEMNHELCLKKKKLYQCVAA